jgi:hypothetical protein
VNIVVLDGYTLNPGDLNWEGLEALDKKEFRNLADALNNEIIKNTNHHIRKKKK